MIAKRGDVLLDNSHVKKSKAEYSTSTIGTSVYLNIEFNKEGKKKLEEITKTYVQTTNEDGETTTKKIAIKLDDQQLLETYFDETITSGSLPLSIGNATTSGETIQDYLKQASQVASLITNEKMDIQYELDNNTYLSSTISNNELKITAYVLAVIVAIALIVLCIKYKSNGVFASISFIGFIALMLIGVRYANIQISLAGIATFAVVLIINYLFVNYILNEFKKENDLDKGQIIKAIYAHYLWILLPVLMASIVFMFMNWLPIVSTGVIMFIGLIIIFIYNYIISKTLLK